MANQRFASEWGEIRTHNIGPSRTQTRVETGPSATSDANAAGGVPISASGCCLVVFYGEIAKKKFLTYLSLLELTSESLPPRDSVVKAGLAAENVHSLSESLSCSLCCTHSSNTEFGRSTNGLRKVAGRKGFENNFWPFGGCRPEVDMLRGPGVTSDGRGLQGYSGQ